MVIPKPRSAIYEYRYGIMSVVFRNATVMKDDAFVVKITICVHNLAFHYL